MATNYERHLSLAYDGRITFDAFARATHKEHERMAVYLVRRWAPPGWYAQADLVQELLVATWIVMWSWAPRLGPSLARYVVYNAMSRAKRALHKARGASLTGSPDRNPSCIDRPFSSFERDDGSAIDLGREEAIAEEALIEREEREAALDGALESCETDEERDVIRAIARAGDVDGGGLLIYQDMRARVTLRLPSEEHAARYAARTAERVVARRDGARQTG